MAFAPAAIADFSLSIAFNLAQQPRIAAYSE
jgi:hypothetical protein